MGPHKSRPYNPLIANTFFRAGFIEAWGRGIQKIKDSCIQAGNDIPEYYVKKEDIMVLFRGLSETTPQSPQTTPQLDEIDSKITDIAVFFGALELLLWLFAILPVTFSLCKKCRHKKKLLVCLPVLAFIGLFILGICILGWNEFIKLFGYGYPT